MRWSKVCLEAIEYELPEQILTTAELDARLAPLYQTLRLAPGQIEMLTGIRERRVWPAGTRIPDCAARAGRKAIEAAGISASDLDAVVYAGVCREELEPAVACAVAEAIGAPPQAVVFDVSNACLGVLNGMVEVANRIELGQASAGLVVSAESTRSVVEATTERMLTDPSHEQFRLGLATMTLGCGAVGVVLTSMDLSDSQRRLAGGAALSAPEHHRLCRWGSPHGLLGEAPSIMCTDAPALLRHGESLAHRTWQKMLENLGWRHDDVDKVICHQVGQGYRASGIEERDLAKAFWTYETFGNIGTVSLPMTAAMAAEQGFVVSGDRVVFLGVASGLNCVTLAILW